MQPIVQQALKKIIRSQPRSANIAARGFRNVTKSKLTEAKRRDLIRQESQIGAKLFGEIPNGHKREFFCLDSRTWIWHESWSDNLAGTRTEKNIRYEVRDNGILKSVNGAELVWVDEAEASNLAQAAVLYHQYVSALIYNKKLDSTDANPPKLELIPTNA
jgi:hypothetical protein